MLEDGLRGDVGHLLAAPDEHQALAAVLQLRGGWVERPQYPRLRQGGRHRGCSVPGLDGELPVTVELLHQLRDRTCLLVADIGPMPVYLLADIGIGEKGP